MNKTKLIKESGDFRMEFRWRQNNLTILKMYDITSLNTVGEKMFLSK